MIALVAIAFLWSGMHNAAFPDTAPHFRDPRASVVQTTPVYGPLVSISDQDLDKQRTDTRHHAQRGDVGPGRWQERRFHGLE